MEAVAICKHLLALKSQLVHLKQFKIIQSQNLQINTEVPVLEMSVQRML